MKKGFTLVELLAVIAMLAILVIIALPNVIGMFNTAKESSFLTECQNIYKVAEQQWIKASLSNDNTLIYSSNGIKLDLSGRDNIEYFVKFDRSGNIVHFVVFDGTFQLYAGYEDNIVPIKSNEFGVSDSNAKYKISRVNFISLLPSVIPNNEYILGDIDRNGEITNEDTEILNKYLSHNVDIPEPQKTLSDVNGDNVVNKDDYNEIVAYIEGKSSVLNNKAKYTVKHYKQIKNYSGDDGEDENYFRLDSIDKMEGMIGQNVSGIKKEYNGFITPTTNKSAVVKSDGTTEIKYFYHLKKYNLTITSKKSYKEPMFDFCISGESETSVDHSKDNLIGFQEIKNIQRISNVVKVNNEEEEEEFFIVESEVWRFCNVGGWNITGKTIPVTRTYKVYSNDDVTLSLSGVPSATNIKWYEEDNLICEGFDCTIKTKNKAMEYIVDFD